MAGRLAIDFGTSNTVVALWDPAAALAVPVWLPDLGQRLPGPGGQSIAVVPSLIHYVGPGQRWLGQQVRRHDLAEAPATFRWMKRYVGRRSPVRRRVDGGEVSYPDAARDFLAGVIAAAGLEAGPADDEVGLTVPV